MKEIKEMWSEMDYEEKRDVIGSAISWAGLLFIGFMISVMWG